MNATHLQDMLMIVGGIEMTGFGPAQPPREARDTSALRDEHRVGLLDSWDALMILFQLQKLARLVKQKL